MKHMIKPAIIIVLTLTVVSYLVSGVYLNSKLDKEINDLTEEAKLYQAKRVELAEQKRLLEQKRQSLENELELQLALAEERKIQAEMQNMSTDDQANYLQELKALEEAEANRLKELQNNKIVVDTKKVTSAS